ncbi:hypothetical protein DY328_02455 [Streptococcus agalactiae]|nr:hypothetical protein DY328_02455 [Streptococcus agalactiae]
MISTFHVEYLLIDFRIRLAGYFDQLLNIPYYFITILGLLSRNTFKFTRRTHENFLFILLCPDINFEKIPF